MAIVELKKHHIGKGRPRANESGASSRPRALLIESDTFQISAWPFAEGASGRVFWCRNLKTRELHAYKELYLRSPKHLPLPVDTTSYPAAVREVQMLRVLRPQELVAVVALRQRRVGFIQKLHAGTLLHAIARLRRDDAHFAAAMEDVLARVAAQLEGMHAKAIVHNDVKPGNMFYRWGPRGVEISLLDFGLSFELDDEDDEDETIQNTSAYAAPETLAGRSGYPVDMWALGVSFMRLLGVHPFQMFIDEPVKFDAATPSGCAARVALYEAFDCIRRGEPLLRSLDPAYRSILSRAWRRVRAMGGPFAHAVYLLTSADPGLRPQAAAVAAMLGSPECRRRNAAACWNSVERQCYVSVNELLNADEQSLSEAIGLLHRTGDNEDDEY